MALKKQINVRVDSAVRHRFLVTGAHFAGQWVPLFAEEFGQDTSPRGQAA
ncbi:hypothetical protein [Streptomyces sp. AcE210]|nr:hypothetical protein [Streptomyces sp. AcE210]